MTRPTQAPPVSARPGTGRPLRIVRLANFGTPRPDVTRTALRRLGEGYRAAGHEAILVVPGDRPADELTPQGRVITVPGAVRPGNGSDRLLPGQREMVRLLDGLRPDRLEVTDRYGLRWAGRWARRNGVPSLLACHESLAGVLGAWGVPVAARQRAAAVLNRRIAAVYDRIVCTTAWAAAEFRSLGVPQTTEVPFGVDLDAFHPRCWDPSVRARYARPDEVLLVYCGRLSPDKRPELAVDTLAALRAAKAPAVLVVAGDGPRRAALAYRSARLPVRFAGHVADRAHVAALLACADVVVAPSAVETVGRAALQAMACGTPVVVDAAGPLGDLVGDAGIAVPGTADGFAEGVRAVLERAEPQRRADARARAELFGWPAAVAGFLRAHGAQPLSRVGAATARATVPVIRPPAPRRARVGDWFTPSGSGPITGGVGA